jgi:ABC-type transporter Mla MlaB component
MRPIAATMPAAAPLWLAAGWTVVVIGGATTPLELCALCDRATSLFGDGGLVVCDLSDLQSADIATVDRLARLRLSARRLGTTLHMRLLSPQLAALLCWTGLERFLLDAPR